MWGIGLIAIRIWRVNKLSMSLGASSLMPVMLVIIESGAIYSAALTYALATYFARSWVEYILVDAVRGVISRFLILNLTTVLPRCPPLWYVLRRGALEYVGERLIRKTRELFSAWSLFGLV